jgi:hypothetical protein
LADAFRTALQEEKVAAALEVMCSGFAAGFASFGTSPAAAQRSDPAQDISTPPQKVADLAALVLQSRPAHLAVPYGRPPSSSATLPATPPILHISMVSCASEAAAMQLHIQACSALALDTEAYLPAEALTGSTGRSTLSLIQIAAPASGTNMMLFNTHARYILDTQKALFVVSP